MSKSFKVAALLAVTAMFLAAPVFGQSLFGGWESPTSTATAGIVTSDADDFIKPDSFTNVEFDNWFGFTSFQSSSGLNIGYATRVNDLYLSVYYGGKFWAGVNSFDYTEGTAVWLGASKDGIRQYSAIPEFTTSPSNELAVLLGLESMAFRLSFYSTHQTFSANDVLFDGIPFKSYVKSYTVEEGDIVPSLAWSLTNGLTDNGIKPWVSVDLVFHRDYAKRQLYTSTTPYVVGDEYIITSDNYFNPVISLGLGGFDVAAKGDFTLTADLSYALSIKAYSNEYNYTDSAGDNKIGTIQGTVDLSNNEYIITSEDAHLITPSIYGSWEDEKLTLGFGLDLSLELRNTNSADMAFKTNTTSGDLWKDGTEETTSDFYFSPSLSLGAQWRISPKLALNAGGSISVSLSTTTTNGKSYADDKEVADSSTKSVKTNFGGVSNELSAGFTLNATDNLTFGATCGIGSNNSISVFDTYSSGYYNTTKTDGLFSFTNFLVSLKF
jgi:hypothetical protein